MGRAENQERKDYVWVKQILTFINGIHDGKTCEIRFFHSWGRGSYSILLNGESIYGDHRRDCKKSFICTLTPKSLDDELINGLFWSKGGTVTITVNSPNFDKMSTSVTSDVHIKNGGSINCQFVDIDAPKAVRNNQLDLKRWKKSVKDEILKFPLRPSIVVNTKNGYHVYWLLKEGKQNLFRHIQMQLIQHFNGDRACVNESRVMRLPFFMHTKDPKNPYPVKVKIFEPRNRYAQEELREILPSLKEKTVKKVLEKTEKPATESITQTRINSVVDLLLTKIDYVKVYEKKITMHCCLPDHPDRNPSTWIDTEYMWFHCSGCGSQYPIRELALKLGWNDVLEAWDKYNVDIGAEINKIKEHFITVNDLPHLVLTIDEQEIVNNIATKVVKQLESFGQKINEKHKQYIYDIVQIMFKANKEKPYLIPLDMGGGKSLIINIFLQELLSNNHSGAVVSVERTADVNRLVDEINDGVGRNVAFPMYGFREKECLQNVRNGTKHVTCPAKKSYKCPYLKECRYWIQSEKQEGYPIVVMTSQRLLQDSSTIDKYSFFKVPLC